MSAYDPFAASLSLTDLAHEKVTAYMRRSRELIDSLRIGQSKTLQQPTAPNVYQQQSAQPQTSTDILQSTTASILRENRDLKFQLDQLTKYVAQLRQNPTQCKSNLKQLQTEHLKKSVAETAVAVEELRAELQKLVDENESLKTNTNKTSETVAKLTVENEVLRKQNQQLFEQFQQQQYENLHKSQSVSVSASFSLQKSRTLEKPDPYLNEQIRLLHEKSRGKTVEGTDLVGLDEDM